MKSLTMSDALFGSKFKVGSVVVRRRKNTSYLVAVLRTSEGISKLKGQKKSVANKLLLTTGALFCLGSCIDSIAAQTDQSVNLQSLCFALYHFFVTHQPLNCAIIVHVLKLTKTIFFRFDINTFPQVERNNIVLCGNFCQTSEFGVCIKYMN